MGQQKTSRLFLALWPSATIRGQLRERRDAWQWPRGARPVHADKLHLTLHFLGGMTQVVIKLRQLFGWEHAHANLPLAQRATVEFHFLVEQMSELVHSLDGCLKGGLADNRLVRLLDLVHIVGGFDFHGQA